MQETVQEYTQRLLSYGEGSDPLRLQQAAPKKLALLLKGKTGKQLMRLRQTNGRSPRLWPIWPMQSWPFHGVFGRY